jgi:ATP-dependent helicase/nuclease subunit B
VQATFLLGPAGIGKTFRCLEEIRVELKASPEGLPLVFLAPKQATFQLERQLLADPELPGYTRLQIVSFERLAEFIFEWLKKPLPKLLSEEGRVMVLRALLGQKQKELKVFHASARLPGFAHQLSLLLRELQRHHLAAARLERLSHRMGAAHRLADKLHDLALLLRAYLDWLEKNNLQDANGLLDEASKVLRRAAGRNEARVSSGAADSRAASALQQSPIRLAGLWLDGFAEMTPQELELLAAVTPCSERATLAFCLEGEPRSEESWLSPWAVVSQTFRRCHQALSALPECEISIEPLPRDAHKSRFTGHPVLQHLEHFWSNPRPCAESSQAERILRSSHTCPSDTLPPSDGERDGMRGDLPFGSGSVALRQTELPLYVRETPARSQSSETRDDAKVVPPTLEETIRIAACCNPEAEAVLAAREILRHVRVGGRYRDCAVLLRQFDDYHDPLRRVFRRYEIPFFLDRREPVAHHPLAELTRFALRTVAFGWKQEDWFGALKTGLVPVDNAEIDWLENEALARGWQGETWRQPLRIPDEPGLEQVLEPVRKKILPPFDQLARAWPGFSTNPPGRSWSQPCAPCGASWASRAGSTTGPKPRSRSSHRPVALGSRLFTPLCGSK